MCGNNVLDLLDTAWSGSLMAKSLEPMSPRSVNSCSIYTTTATDSTPSSIEDEIQIGEAMEVLHEPKAALEQLRTVHKISPLVSFTPERLLTFVLLPPASAAQPTTLKALAFGHTGAENPKAASTALKAHTSTDPVPIPGALQDDLERKTSLIKAVPGRNLSCKPVNIRSQVKEKSISNLPPASGSWTKRQICYPLDQPEKQPVVPQKWAAIKAKALRAKAARDQEKGAAANADGDRLAMEVAWRFRFKKKWIREELFARKMEFPDDPEYEDQWADALNFIETCGCGAALQAAFLEVPPDHMTDSQADVMDGLDSILLEGEEEEPYPLDRPFVLPSRETSVGPEVAAKAATLVRMNRCTLVA